MLYSYKSWLIFLQILDHLPIPFICLTIYVCIHLIFSIFNIIHETPLTAYKIRIKGSLHNVLNIALQCFTRLYAYAPTFHRAPIDRRKCPVSWPPVKVSEDESWTTRLFRQIIYFEVYTVYDNIWRTCGLRNRIRTSVYLSIWLYCSLYSIIIKYINVTIKFNISE